MGGPDAVSTLHLSDNSALTADKLRELADLLDGPRAGLDASHIYGDPPDEDEIPPQLRIHRSFEGPIIPF